MHVVAGSRDEKSDALHIADGMGLEGQRALLAVENSTPKENDQ